MRDMILPRKINRLNSGCNHPILEITRNFLVIFRNIYYCFMK